MKKRITAILAGAMAAALLMSGCSASNDASNDSVTVTGYKGIEVKGVADPDEITDEDVETYIQSILTTNTTTEAVTDRPVQDGDIVNINYVGTIDGAEFDGGSYDGYDLTIGSDSFIDGFEDSIIGHSIGETFDWNGSFPEDYGNTEYAGKAVTFTITVNSISVSKTPELNDEFVQTVSEESKTVDEYRKEVKTLLEKNAENSFNSSLQEAAWSAVLEKAEVKKYPEGEPDASIEEMKAQYTSAAEYYGMTLEDFLSTYYGTTEEDFTEQMKTAAETNVKNKLVADAIADKEKLVPSDDEYQEEFVKLAEQYGYEDADSLIEAAGEDTLKDIVVQNRVKAFIAENAIRVKE